MVKKDVIKVPLLSKLKPGAQALNSVAVDFVYEVNKPGATDKQVKSEMAGAVGSAGAGLLFGYSKLSDTPKIFFNVVGGGIVGNESKKIYEERSNNIKKER